MAAPATKHQDQVLRLCDELDLPLDVLTQPISLLANREGGKTFGGMKLFELAYDAGVQCGAIENVGKWGPGLRRGKDGQPDGGLKNVYVFGGRHADLPLEASQGAFIAQLVVEKHIHFILDVSLMRKGDRRRFLTDFLEELHLRKKQEENPSAMILFLEEAHFIAPQKPGPDEMRMLGAIEDIVREGRNFGIGVVIMDQRPATVNKNVLNLTEVVIALRIIHNIDRKVIEDWIVQKVEPGQLKIDLAKELPFLRHGKGFLYAPAYGLFGRIQILPKRTYDSTASVKIGAKRLEVGALAPVDIEAVRSAMGTVLKENEANDPKALRKRIAELERELKAKPVPAAPAPKVERVEVPVLKESELKRLEKIGNDCLLTAAEAEQASKHVAETVRAAFAKAPPLPPTRINPAQSVSPPRPTLRERLDAPGTREAVDRARAKLDASDAATLQKGSRDILRMLVAVHPSPLTRTQLGVLVGMRSDTGHFGNCLGELRTAGLIAYGDDGNNVATDAGVALIGHWRLPSSGEVLERWKGKLEGGSRKILAALERAPMNRTQLGLELGMQSSTGHFGNLLGALRGADLIVKEGGKFRISDAVYLGDR